MSPDYSKTSSIPGVAVGSLYNLVGAVVTTVGGFGAVWIVSRHFGGEVTGTLFTAVGLFLVLAGACKLGTEASLTWYIATSDSGTQTPVQRSVVSSALTRVAGTAAVLGAAMAVLSGSIAAQLADSPSLDRDLGRMLIVLGLALPFWSVAQASYGVSRGYGIMHVSVFAGSILRPAVLVTTLILIVWLSSNVWLLSLAWGAAGLAAMAASLAWILNRLGWESTRSPAERMRFWTYAKPRAASDILHSILERADLLLLSALATSAAAGEFVVASRLVLVGQLLLVAISQAVAPVVGRLLADRKSGEAGAVVRLMTSWGVLVTWPPMIILAINARGVGDLFGSEFADAAGLIQIMAVGVAVMAALGPGDTILLMTGDSHGSMKNHIAALAALLIVGAATIPFLGATGAALSWASARVVLRALSVWRIQRATGIECVDRSVGINTVLTMAAFAPLGLLLWILEVDGLLAALLNAVLGAAIAAGLVLVTQREWLNRSKALLTNR